MSAHIIALNYRDYVIEEISIYIIKYFEDRNTCRLSKDKFCSRQPIKHNIYVWNLPLITKLIR